MDAKGLNKGAKKRGEYAAGESVWVAAPFEILGACRDPHGHGWGKWLRWQDADRRLHVRHVSDAALQGESSALCAGLADAGLAINRAHQREFANYLVGVKVKGRVTIVTSTGWHKIGEQSVFVLPELTIGPHGAERAFGRFRNRAL